ncbi:MAG: hypothetical protein K2J42_08635 [Muribaculaceae bacterium]|nr:hypothetical protein [Muribaculaceae bacterium]
MDALQVLNYTQQFKDENGYNSNIYYNDSILHATIILRELLIKAAQENSKTLNMYCGKFSLFRDETQRKVENVKLDCDSSTLLGEQIVKWAEFKPFDELQKQLSEFINDKNGTLNLIIERDFETLQKNKVWGILKAGMENNRVRIFILTEKLGVGHFAVTEEAYRIEDSDDNKTATGCFVDRENASILNDNFDSLKKLSIKVAV